MTDNERQLQAIRQHGEALTKRAEWLQKMIERQEDTIANCQKAVEHFRADLLATNLAIDALRVEYRKGLAGE